MIDEKEFRKLQAQVHQLSADFEQFKAATMEETHDITRHILHLQTQLGKAFRTLSDVYDYIWPLVDKVLPDFVKDANRIDDLMRGKKPKPS